MTTSVFRKIKELFSLRKQSLFSKRVWCMQTRSYSFQRGKTENITIFHTLSDTSSKQSSSSSSEREISSDSDEREEAVANAKAKVAIEAESASESEKFINGRKCYQRSPSEPGPSSKGFISSLSVEQNSGEQKLQNEGVVVESMPNNSRRNNWLKRRTLSSI